MKPIHEWGLNSKTEAPTLLMTSREAAAALRVSERTLYSWSRSGRLPRVVIGGAVRYDLQDLKRMIDGAKTPAGEGGGR